MAGQQDADLSDDAESTPIAKLLAAASSLTDAATIVIETVRAPQLLDQEVAGFAADPTGEPPLGEAVDKLCDAILCIAGATGERADLDRLVDAANRWIRGED